MIFGLLAYVKYKPYWRLQMFQKLLFVKVTLSYLQKHVIAFFGDRIFNNLHVVNINRWFFGVNLRFNIYLSWYFFLYTNDLKPKYFSDFDITYFWNCQESKRRETRKFYGIFQTLEINFGINLHKYFWVLSNQYIRSYTTFC